MFKDFCMFIGYPRSGHSLIGALLNAHPEILISHEYDVVKYIDKGLSFETICKGIIARNSWFQQKENKWNGYHYNIPNQFQNKLTGYNIIGDKKGGRTTHRFMENNSLIALTIKKIPLDIKWIHVIRNPYNIISSMTRYKGTLEENTDLFIKYHKTVLLLKSNIANHNIINIYHEDLFLSPQSLIVDLLTFLGKKSYDNYIKDCTSVLFKKANNTKKDIQWSRHLEFKLDEFIATSNDLSRYLKNKV